MNKENPPHAEIILSINNKSEVFNYSLHHRLIIITDTNEIKPKDTRLSNFYKEVRISYSYINRKLVFSKISHHYSRN